MIKPDPMAMVGRSAAAPEARLTVTMIARRDYMRAGEGARSLELIGVEMSADALALRTYAARQQLRAAQQALPDDLRRKLAQELSKGRGESR